MDEVIAASIPEHPGSLGNRILTPDEHLSTRTGGGYQYFYGSSMSAARVTALISLMLERQPGLSRQDAREHLGAIHARCQDTPGEELCSMKFALSQDRIAGHRSISSRAP